MSAFTMGLTAKGAALYAKAQTGTSLHFTRIALGDGDLGTNQAINLNALVSEKVSLAVSELKVLTGGKAVIGGVMQPKDVTVGFYWRELGLFAQDPDVGEILYYYGNAGSQSEWIPPNGGGTLVEKHINVTPIVGNATNVTATIDQSLVYATVQELSEHEKDYTLQIPYAGITTGSANTYGITTPEITSLNAGMAVAVKFNADSTGASTLNWCGVGAKPIKKSNGSDATNLKASGIYTLRYDGTNFILQGEGASGNATASDLLSGKTASTDAGDITGTMTNNGPGAAETINLTAQNQEYTIAAGYHSGLRKIKAVIANFTANIIAAGVTVGGIIGTYTSDATAAAAQILASCTAYVNGKKITGSMANKTGTTQTAGFLSNGQPGPTSFSWDTAIPAAGYYDTTSKISTTITNLTTGTVKYGVTLTEIALTGSFTGDGNIDANKVLAGYRGYSKGAAVDGAIVSYSGTHQAAGSSYIEGTRLHYNSFPTGYYVYGNNTVYLADSNWVEANIKNGVSIFGKTGTYKWSYRAGDYTLFTGGELGTSVAYYLYEWIPQHSGTVRISFSLKHSSGSATAYAQIMKGAADARSAAGTLRSTTSTSYITYTEDIEVTAGVPISLHAYSSGNFYYVSNFKICTDVDFNGINTSKQIT